MLHTWLIQKWMFNPERIPPNLFIYFSAWILTLIRDLARVLCSATCRSNAPMAAPRWSPSLTLTSTAAGTLKIHSAVCGRGFLSVGTECLLMAETFNGRRGDGAPPILYPTWQGIEMNPNK